MTYIVLKLDPISIVKNMDREVWKTDLETAKQLAEECNGIVVPLTQSLMNSTELIGSCKKTFQEYHEERESFEEGLMGYLYHKYHITVDRKDLDYFLSATKSWHWKSFYNGYLEGATQHLKYEQNTTT